MTSEQHAAPLAQPVSYRPIARQCRWCAESFAVALRPGRPRLYCRSSCRQRAYERRRGLGVLPPSDRLAMVQGGPLKHLPQGRPAYDRESWPASGDARMPCDQGECPSAANGESPSAGCLPGRYRDPFGRWRRMRAKRAQMSSAFAHRQGQCERRRIWRPCEQSSTMLVPSSVVRHRRRKEPPWRCWIGCSAPLRTA